jgi:hypothetical protein
LYKSSHFALSCKLKTTEDNNKDWHNINNGLSS